MVERELFEIYVAGLTETNQFRQVVEERLRDTQEITLRLNSRVEQRLSMKPIDPDVVLRATEIGKAIRAASTDVTKLGIEIVATFSRFESDFLARAQEMLSIGNYDLRSLLEERLNEARRRFTQDLSRLLSSQKSFDEARLRLEVLFDESLPETTN